MEEYIRLEEEKSQKHRRKFNWKTATFGKVKYYENEDDCFADFETEFPVIVFNNTLTSDTTLPYEPMVSSTSKNKIDFRISLDESDDEDYTIRDTLGSDTRLRDMMRVLYTAMSRGSRIYGVAHRFDMRQDLAMMLRMVYTRGDGQQLGGIRRRMTWRQFILALGLHTEKEMAEAGFGAYWAGSDRVIPDKGDLKDYWIEILSDRYFLGPAPSYVLIRDPVRRLCHRMIAYSISGRRQAPEKVIGIGLFYLRNMDQGTANVLHLLAQYLFRHAKGRKSGARLLGGHFIGRLAAHFGLVSDEGLRGLQVATAGVHEADEASLTVDEGAQDVLAPAQAPSPPLPVPQPRTMSQRINRIEEEMRDLRHDVVGLLEVFKSFTTEQSRVSTWLISYMTQLMDASGHTYQAFENTLVGSSRIPY
ncbi:hypothetical protein Tco_1274621 [Tanacetum coccineum]